MKQIILLPHQKTFVESVAKEVIQSGAYGSGKSRALCAKILFLLTRYPNNRGYLCRKTLQSLKTSTLKTLLDGDGDNPPLLDKSIIQFHNKQDRLIKLRNGSELYYGPMDMEFIKSTNFGFVAVDELSEFTEEEWNALISRTNRLSGIPVSQAFAATNPASPQHWIYNRAVVNPIKDLDGITPRVEFIKSCTLDNTYLPKEYTENLKRTLFGFYYQRYVLGEWVGTDSLVYDNYVPDIHLIKPFVVPKEWSRYRAVDFGYRNPFSCLWVAIAGKNANKLNPKLESGDIIVYREYYYTQRITSLNAKRVIEFSKYHDNTNEHINYTVSDWDAGDRADLESEGIRTVKANKDITLGIQKVRERLGNNDTTRGDIIRPRLYFFENTICEKDPKIKVNIETGSKNNNPEKLIEEFMCYSWKENKEEPIDEFNHALDALRYFIMAYDMGVQWANIPFRKV